MKTLQNILIQVSDDGHLFVNGVDTHQAVLGGNEALRIAYKNGYSIEVYWDLSGGFRICHNPSWSSTGEYRTALIPQEPKKVPMTREDIEVMIVSKRTWFRDICNANNGDKIVGPWCEMDTQDNVDYVIKNPHRLEYSHDLKTWHKFEKEVHP